MSLLTSTAWPALRSLGPSSTLRGTPLSSHSLNFLPGVRWSRSSSRARWRFDSRAWSFAASASTSFLLSSLTIGTITTWMRESLGGTTAPLSSPCVASMTPISRVVIAKVFCQAYWFSPSWSTKVISKAFENFWPSECQSGPWMAFPSGSRCSMLYVASAPANFSWSVFLPVHPGIARNSSVILRSISSIWSLSASASSLVAKMVCPSFHRNSLPRRKGVGCLNSHLTTLFHWLSLRGRSLQERIHLAATSYITVSEVGRMASLSSSFESPASVTHATSGEKPSTCSCSFFSSLSGMKRGK